MKNGWYWFREHTDPDPEPEWTIVHVDNGLGMIGVTFAGNDIVYVLTDNPRLETGYTLHYTIDPAHCTFVPLSESAPTMPPLE